MFLLAFHQDSTEGGGGPLLLFFLVPLQHPLSPSLSLSLALSLANAAVMQVNLKPPSVARYQFDVRWPIPITSLLIKPALHFLALVALAISRADTIGSLLQLS